MKLSNLRLAMGMAAILVSTWASLSSAAVQNQGQVGGSQSTGIYDQDEVAKDPLNWSESAEVTLADFKAPHEKSSEALLRAKFVLTYKRHIAYTRKGKALRVELDVQPQFDKGSSWLSPELKQQAAQVQAGQTPGFLTHVNGRFDLVAIYLHIFKLRIEALDVRGLTRKNETQIVNQIRQIYGQVVSELEKEEVEYDTYTEWGVKTSKENEKRDEFTRRLNALKQDVATSVAVREARRQNKK